MKPVLLIFLDGMMPESVERIDLLNSMPNKSRLVGKYGFSIACHASMYTGLEIADHKYWFVWQRQPGQGLGRDHRWLRSPLFDNIPSRLLAHKFLFRKDKALNTSFFGLPRLVHCRTSELVDLTVTEWKNYDEPGYIPDQVSFLDEFRAKGLKLDLVGMDKTHKEESVALDEWRPRERADVTYWFMGDVDHFSHKMGQQSESAARKFARLNDIMSRAFKRYVRFYGEEPIILAWSDHGHAEMTKYIDPFAMGPAASRILASTPHVVDATYIRLWRTTEDDRTWQGKIDALADCLSPWVDVLDEARQRKLTIWPGDDRFGHVALALKRGAAFTRTIWGWSRGVISQHGYDPAEPEMDGFIASNTVPLTGGRVPITEIYHYARSLVASSKSQDRPRVGYPEAVL